MSSYCSQIDKADEAAVEYFGQELSVKKQFPRPSVMTENPGTGYCEIGTERYAYDRTTQS